MSQAERPFAVFDIDGTVIRWQLFHAIVDELIAGNKLPKSVGASIKAARMTWKKRNSSNSYKDYEHHVWQSYMAAVTEISIVDLEQAVSAVFEKYKDQVYTYTRNLIRDLKAKGYLLLAVSGSHHEIVSKLADYYGFDDSIGTQYVRKNGAFTGEEIAVVTRKDEALQELVSKHSVTWKGSIGVGDARSDAAMLKLVENPIAFNPNQELFEIAQENSWKVVVERKNMIYELEKAGGVYALTGCSDAG